MGWQLLEFPGVRWHPGLQQKCTIVRWPLVGERNSGAKSWHGGPTVLVAFDPSRLDELSGGKGDTTCADLITGVLLHDTYHAGQIQMLKRLARSQGL